MSPCPQHRGRKGSKLHRVCLHGRGLWCCSQGRWASQPFRLQPRAACRGRESLCRIRLTAGPHWSSVRTGRWGRWLSGPKTMSIVGSRSASKFQPCSSLFPSPVTSTSRRKMCGCTTYLATGTPGNSGDSGPSAKLGATWLPWTLVEQALPTCPPLPGPRQAVEMVFCFLQGHAQLLQCDPIADSFLLASGLGFDHLVPGCSPILGEEPQLHPASALAQ